MHIGGSYRVAQLALAVLLLAGLGFFVVRLRHEAHLRPINRILADAESVTQRMGITYDLILDTVRRLSATGIDFEPDDLGPVFAPRLTNTAFLVDCYALRDSALGRAAELIDGGEYEGLVGLRLMQDGGLSHTGMRGLWSRLSSSGQTYLARTSMDRSPGQQWLLPVLDDACVVPADDRVRSYLTVARMRAGRVSAEDVIAHAKDDPSIVYRYQIGLAMAIEGRYEGLAMIAAELATDSPERRGYMGSFCLLFVPPLVDVSRVTDEADALDDLVRRDWVKWIAENRRQLEFRDGRWHLLRGLDTGSETGDSRAPHL